MLVSTVPVTSLEHQALSDEVKDEGVVVVLLGSAFERWKASRMSKAAAGVWEVCGYMIVRLTNLTTPFDDRLGWQHSLLLDVLECLLEPLV